jgi:hypothetical protein
VIGFTPHSVYVNTLASKILVLHRRLQTQIWNLLENGSNDVNYVSANYREHLQENSGMLSSDCDPQRVYEKYVQYIYINFFNDELEGPQKVTVNIYI